MPKPASRLGLAGPALAIPLLVLPILAACASPGVRHDLDAPVPSAWTSQPAPSTAELRPSTRSWEAFHDATLEKLVIQALERNHSLNIAEANLAEARARHVLARSQLFPDISAVGATSRGNPGLQSQNATFSLVQGELDARYDIDLFGGNRQRSQAARQGEGAAAAQRDNVRLSVVAEVAAAYISLRQVQQSLQDANTIAQSAGQIWQMRQTQQQAGLITDAQAQAAFSALQQANNSASRLEDARANLVAGLSVLTGDDTFQLATVLNTEGTVPAAPYALIVDSPLDVVRRRPDVIAAEYQLLSSTAAHRAAMADMFPHLTISAFFGRQDTTLLPGTDVWNATAGLYWPLLNFGRLRAQVNMADAREVAAYETYRLAMTAALSDVETKLTGFQQSRNRLANTQGAYAAQETRFAAVKDQVAQGLKSRLALELARIDLASAHMDLTGAQADMALRYVALQKALAL